jgi:hypothetical protein
MGGVGVRCIVALLAGLAPTASSARVDDPCSQSDEFGRSLCARGLYSRREYSAAARHYERLWLETNAAKYLYNAAAAREAAGHDASALALWTRYADSLARDAAERAELILRLDAMRARLTAVTITVTPAEVLGPAATFWCERADASSKEAFDIPARLVADGVAGRFTVHLSPGAWTLRLSPASGISTYMPIQAAVEVTAHPKRLDMMLTGSDGHPPGSRQSDRARLKLGLGGAASGFAVLGTLVLIFPPHGRLTAPIGKQEAKTWLRGVSGGAGLLGVAVGLGVATGLEGLAPTRRRYYIQLGTGAGVFLVGLATHAILAAKFNQNVATEISEHDADKQRTTRAVSAAMIGAGSALMAGVGASYLVRAWLPQRRQKLGLSGLWRPHTIGLALHGRF